VTSQRHLLQHVADRTANLEAVIVHGMVNSVDQGPRSISDPNCLKLMAN
jgi:hypothetical protein